MRIKLIQCALLLTFCSAATTIHADLFLFNGALDSDGPGTILRLENAKETKGKGWQLKSEGGITYVNPQDERYWFQLNGTLRLDEIVYSGDYKDRQIEFPNNAHIRRLQFGFEGGLGEYWEYTISHEVRGTVLTNAAKPPQSQDLLDSLLGYTGLFKNSELFIGRLTGGWVGIEGSTSSSWLAFLERSSQGTAFYPGNGLGLMYNQWWPCGTVILLAFQPDQRTHILTTDNRSYRSDTWKMVGRTTYVPVNELGNVWHVGVSGGWRQHDAFLLGRVLKDLTLTAPAGGVVPRNEIPVMNLLSTGALPVNYVNQWNLEFVRQWGPWILQAEYAEIYVHRVTNAYGSLRFKGLEIESRFMLTGEPLKYNVRIGSFAGLDICSPWGALEAAFRYDYVNLNDKDIHGGSQKNYGLALNWYINPIIRICGNYSRCCLHPSNIPPNPPPINRFLNVFALRVQFKFR